MRHDPIPVPETPDLARAIVCSLIDRVVDPTIKKNLIMLAWERGVIPADDASDWIATCGLVDA